MQTTNEEDVGMNDKSQADILALVSDMADAGGDGFAVLVDWFCRDQIELRKRLAHADTNTKGGHDEQG